MSEGAEYDVVVYGATGFTGRLVAEFLASRYGVGGSLAWAMAGRSADKLGAVRDAIGAPAQTPCLVADADDPASLRAMCEQARCVLTTVGPYTLYGSGLVAACAETGCDYVDLSGEPLWMREMIATHGARAKQSGARIVHSTGFDSVPFDLGVQFLQEAARERFGAPCPRVRGRVRAMEGSFSGGTAASLAATMGAVAEDPGLLEVLMNPFALCEGFAGPDQPTGAKPLEDEVLGAWVAPFIMAPINTKNVHRSNALMGHAYGEGFVYDEMLVTGPGDAGRKAAEAVASSGRGAGATGDTPKPGEGPSKEEREAGHYDVLFIGTATGGEEVRAVVTGDMDPGYGSTSKIQAETAICLVRECDDVPGGIWTPAASVGQRLVPHLVQKAGLTFDVL